MLKFIGTNRNVSKKDLFLGKYGSKTKYAEAYRTLRTNINFSSKNRTLHSLLVTSSVQQEGKTTAVANLAYTIAQTGKKVLMVDCDLRKQGLSERFRKAKVSGFSNLINDVIGKPIHKGDVLTYGLKDLVQLMDLQQRTCALVVDDEENVCELLFNKGVLLDIFWRNRPEKKRLANILVREKILTAEQANLALGQQKKSVRRLGAILLTLGLVEEETLRKILSMQVMEAYRVVTQMGIGKFFTRPLTETETYPSSLGMSHFSDLTREMFAVGEHFSYIDDCIDAHVQQTDEKSLFLLPSGKLPSNPTELLDSTMVDFLFDNLKKKFDVVVVDSSPILSSSDTLLLAPRMDGTALVVEAGKINRNLVKDSIQQLKKADANFLGVFLNRADFFTNSYSKRVESYYGK